MTIKGPPTRPIEDHRKIRKDPETRPEDLASSNNVDNQLLSVNREYWFQLNEDKHHDVWIRKTLSFCDDEPLLKPVSLWDNEDVIWDVRNMTVNVLNP